MANAVADTPAPLVRSGVGSGFQAAWRSSTIGRCRRLSRLDAAKHFKGTGETITELNAAWVKKIGAIDDVGEIDVVTATKAIEVKSGNLATLNLADFKKQLGRLKDFAAAKGKSACFAIPQGSPIPRAVQEAIDSVGGISVEFF